MTIHNAPRRLKTTQLTLTSVSFCTMKINSTTASTAAPMISGDTFRFAGFDLVSGET
jgi:hypothetical protein